MTFNEIKEEIENLSLIVSIPQIISAPVSYFLISLFSPNPSPHDVIEIIDFLVISFPLTIAVALITLLLRTNQSYFGLYIGAIIGAALLSNFLHRILSAAFPAIDISAAYNETLGTNSSYAYHGAGSLITFTLKIVSLYWQKFGILLFLQSCAIGIYAGVKYYKKKEVGI